MRFLGLNFVDDIIHNVKGLDMPDFLFLPQPIPSSDHQIQNLLGLIPRCPLLKYSVLLGRQGGMGVGGGIESAFLDSS